MSGPSYIYTGSYTGIGTGTGTGIEIGYPIGAGYRTIWEGGKYLFYLKAETFYRSAEILS